MEIDCKVRIKVDDTKLKYLIEDIEILRGKLCCLKETLDEILNDMEIEIVND